MSGDLVAGVFGLGGVIVGGLITAGIDVLSTGRTERRSAQVAARLLRRELMTVSRSVLSAVRSSTWGPTRSLATEAWDEYKAVFATSLTPDEWVTVASAVVQIRRIGQPVIAMHASGWESNIVVLDSDTVEVLRPLYDECRAAFTALYRISREPTSERALHTLEAASAEVDSQLGLSADAA
jgi:hypothetical protein